MPQNPTHLDCPSCGQPNPAASRFCRHCGQPLSVQASTVRCSNCGFENAAGAHFCGECGQMLTATLVQPPAPPFQPVAKKTARPAKPKAKPKPHRSQQAYWLVALGLGGLILFGICGLSGWLVYRSGLLTSSNAVAAQSVTPVTEAEIAVSTPAALSLPTAAPEGSQEPTPVPTPVLQNGTDLSPAPAPEPRNESTGYILWATSGATNIDEANSFDIYLSDTNGENRMLLGSTEKYSGGGFAKSGEWLFFFTRNDEEITLYTARFDGSHLRSAFLAQGRGVGDVAFSDDGSTLYFLVNGGNNEKNGYIYNYHNDRLANLGEYQLVSLSSDGKWALGQRMEFDASKITFHSTDDYALFNTENRTQQKLKASFAWIAPDGKHIVSSDKLYNDHQEYIGDHLQIYDLTQDSWTKLGGVGQFVQFDFLPDGRHALFGERNNSESFANIYLINLETDERIAYLPGDYQWFMIPNRSYSMIGMTEYWGGSFGDRVMIYAVKEMDGAMIQNGRGDIYIANGDGSDLRLVADNAGASFIGDENHILIGREHVEILDLNSNERKELDFFSGFTSFPILDFSPGEISRVMFFYGQLKSNSNFGGLWVLDIKSMDYFQIGSDQANIFIGTFSSDGRKIAYNEIDPDLKKATLYTADPDGNNVRLIAENAMILAATY